VVGPTALGVVERHGVAQDAIRKQHRAGAGGSGTILACPPWGQVFNLPVAPTRIPHVENVRHDT